MKRNVIIFDFDYTLGDSTEGIVQSVNYGMEMLGRAPYEREAIKKTVGLSLKETYRVLTFDEDEQNASIFIEGFKTKADQVMAENTTLFPGVKEVLLGLKSQGLRLGIVTTKYHQRIVQILKLCQAEGIFELIVGGDDVVVQKPDPEGLLFAIQKLGVEKDKVLYVGDSLVDARTAQGACVDFCGVTTGTTPEEDFFKYPHIGIFTGLSEIGKLL